MEYAKNNVGIVGYWFATNYGGVASYYSLYRQIERMGYAPFFIDKPIDKEGMDTFSRNFFKSIDARVSEQHSADEMHKLNSVADIFVLGSDQVLTIRSIKTNGKYFLLEFTDDSKKRIAYSASCGGNSLDSDEKTVAYAKKMLSRFVDVSVREYSAIDIVKSKLGINAQFAIDPIFFTPASEYEELAKTSGLSADENYMLAYILDPDEDKKRCLKEISEHLTLNKKIALDGRKFTYEKNNGLMDMPEATLPQLDFPQWLHYFSNASFIFTDSFHGASMAIIMNKPFIMYANYKRGFPRFETLAKLFDISERMIKKSDELKHDILTENIDFEKLNSIVLREKEKGVKRLKKDIETPSNELPPLLLPPDITQKLDMSSCTGCGACAEICPTDAIEIKPNERGFLNPIVNKEKCVYCGKCTKGCIALNPQYKNTPEPKCYAVMAKDEVRKVSSSGGMFTLGAEYVLNLGGYVCGAAFNKNFEVEHIVIDTLEELDKLRGSKYIQSRAGKIYPKIKELLEQDKYVLFTGMPCQIAGLYSYLGKEHKKLYTIDLLCHGITSQKVFNKYRTEVLEKDERQLTDIKFKAKEPWGWHAGVNADFSDGTHYAEPLERDPYFIAYLKSISKNTACGTCPVNRLPRQGDLTIGDFWKVTGFDPALRDEKGTSVVLINNAAGEELLQKAAEKAVLLKEVPLKYAIAGNHCIEHPYVLNKNNEVFFKHFDELSFDELAKGCRDNRLYEKQYLELVKTVAKEDMEYYCLAKTAAENAHGRQIVTWVRSGKFERILKKYFGLDVAFGISQRKEVQKKDYINDFSILKGHKGKYYLVSLDHAYDKDIYQTLQDFGYSEISDFIFRKHKPIVLENLDLSKGNYYDEFGNSVEGFDTTVGKIVFRGWNNHIILGKSIPSAVNLSFDICSNGYAEIGENTHFTSLNKIEMRGYDGFSSLTIGKNCRFKDSLFRLYCNAHASTVTIGDYCTFESNLDIHANSGKKLIVGNDCMTSHNVHLWAGDGHSIFDVKTGKNINSVYENLKSEKNQLVIGNHVWVAYGAFIMHGTNIADGSIVGAQSVVKGIFPNNCSIAGNPAKIVRTDCAWSRDMQTDDISRCGNPDYTVLTSNAKAPISGLNVLVIGGTRFMGVQLVKELINRGNNVTIATRGNKKDNFGIRINRIKTDVSDEESVKAALNGKYFDVVFDNLAYCSEYVNNILSNVKCGKYIQLSSVEAYANLDIDMKEERFDPYTLPVEICNRKAGYVKGKRQSEAIVYQNFKNITAATVRIPYVTKTDRLYYYCKHVVKQLPMNIPDISKGFTFIRDTEVGKFLPWLAAQNFTGPVNLASEGMVTVKMILDYIEKKTGKKAIIDTEIGSKSPFNEYNEKTFSLNMDKAKQLDYNTSNINDWFWNLMDEYIDRALREK